jgi:hypothetical protein
MKKGVSFLLLLTVVVLTCALMTSSALAQGTSPQRTKIQVTDADNAAAAESTLHYSHALPAKTDAGASLKHGGPAALGSLLAGHAEDFIHAAGEGNDRTRFPGDLTNLFGGPTVGFIQSHPVFLSSVDGTTCAPNTCWGDPDTFLDNFGRSGLSHVTDQYVGQHADDRYTLGDEFVIPFTPSTTPLIDPQIRALVHAVAAFSGETGLNHEFHIFLPPGQDECFDASFATCYSPDNGNTFVFCAYHNAVAFQDIGIVLYSVEPFQNVPGCHVRPGTVNGQTIDSTNSTLSHELIETITDPLGSAWRNFTDNALAGAEIADECQLIAILPVGNHLAVFGDPIEFSVGHHRFATQPEYSNEDHACVIRP